MNKRNAKTWTLKGAMILIMFSQCNSIQKTALKPVEFIIDQHTDEGTHYDGPRCPMYPSCSAYAKQAIQQKGFYGFLLAIDRLFFREFGNLRNRFFITPRHLSDTPRYYDPLSDSKGVRPSFFNEDFSH